MTVFSRTASGLANYHKFHGADFTAYVEGKSDHGGTESIIKTNDIYYYEYLLRVASRGKNPKIKCVGNKEAAFEYARKIREGGIPGSIVIVDKDLEGLTSSPLDQYPVIRTFGYSWENEMWTANTMSAILDSLTHSNPSATAEIDKYTPILAKRLRFLSSLDAASQTHGVALLTKRSSLCGVSFNFPRVTVAEIGRLTGKFRASPAFGCDVSREVVREGLRLDPRQVIQGHFWSNVAQRLVAHIYKKLTGDVTPSNALLTHLALSHMRRDPSAAVGKDIVARYGLELARYGI